MEVFLDDYYCKLYLLVILILNIVNRNLLSNFSGCFLGDY